MSAKIKEYKGEEVKSADIKEGKVLTIRQRPRIRYLWSAGVAMSRFLKELKEGRIIATTCKRLSLIHISEPTRPY